MKLLLPVVLIAAVQSGMASPGQLVSPSVTQIVVTQYTGAGSPTDPARKADPIYRLALRSDGTALYVGNKTYMKRIGRYQGMVQSADFEKLAALIQKSSSPQRSGSAAEAAEVYEITCGDHKETFIVDESCGVNTWRQASKVSYGLLWKIHWRQVSASDTISQ